MLKLAKYHGLGNDFLLVEGTDGDRSAAWGPVARGLCERHRGVGADGLIVAMPGSGGSELTMWLYNADGSRAETSGNGLRCMALFAREAGLTSEDDFVVATDAGPREVSVGPISATGLATVRVDMGCPTIEETELEIVDPLGGPGWRGCRVDVGNPHLVLVESSLEGLDLHALGPLLEASRTGGLNVEWLRARPGLAELDLRVWERGVGITLACGTGSVAAASAGVAMGLVDGPSVLVHNPGGTIAVELTEAGAWLSGPAQRVAWCEVRLDPAPEGRFGEPQPADSQSGPGDPQPADPPARDPQSGDPPARDPQPEPDDWAVVAEGAVEWGWDWATGSGWGHPKG